jgi:hypothetical protein
LIALLEGVKVLVHDSNGKPLTTLGKEVIRDIKLQTSFLGDALVLSSMSKNPGAWVVSGYAKKMIAINCRADEQLLGHTHRMLTNSM